MIVNTQSDQTANHHIVVFVATAFGIAGKNPNSLHNKSTMIFYLQGRFSVQPITVHSVVTKSLMLPFTDYI